MSAGDREERLSSRKHGELSGAPERGERTCYSGCKINVLLLVMLRLVCLNKCIVVGNVTLIYLVFDREEQVGSIAVTHVFL